MSLLTRPLVIVAAFSGSGASLKLADLLGERGQSIPSYITAIVSGTLLGNLMGFGAQESSYVTGIIVGVALGGKINRPNLLAGLVTVALTSLILGFVWPVPWLLSVVTGLSLLDEILHDHPTCRVSGLNLIFKYRPGLKLGTVFLAMASQVSLTTALGFFSFDLSYDIVSFLVKESGFGA